MDMLGFTLLECIQLLCIVSTKATISDSTTGTLKQATIEAVLVRLLVVISPN